MADKLPDKAENDNVLTAHNQIRTVLNRGNNVPEMTLSEIKTAQAAEIAAGRTFNAIIKNTTTEQLEYWNGNCDIGRPL